MTKIRRRRVALAGFLLAAMVTVGMPRVWAAPSSSGDTPIFVDTRAPNLLRTNGPAARLIQKAVREGEVRVIAGIDLQVRREDELSPAELQSQTLRVSSMQDSVVAGVLGRTSGDDIVKFDNMPFFSIFVNADQLRRLLSDRRVVNIAEDVPVRPTVYNIYLTETNKVWEKGFEGRGYTVAILDTGADGTHPMLAGKLVSEACYSTTNAKQHAQSLCPGGARSSTAKGSGKFCPLTIDGCDHGTHVSSIAVGNAGNGLFGIAKSASFMSIQVFSKLASVDTCKPDKSPCGRTYTTDQISALKRVYALRNTFKIAAANMSLGSGAYSGTCDASSPALTMAIGNLRAVNIATVVAAGNNGVDGGIGFPACISSAVSVASTDEADDVSGFSNFGSTVTLAAPGSGIYGAIPHGGYAYKSGTSMAAPAVAGAFAVLRQITQTADVTGLVNVLQCGGQLVSRAKVNKERFDLLRTYNALKFPPDKTETFTFSTQAVADYWTTMAGTWAVGTGALNLTAFNTTPNSYFNGIWFPSCSNNVQVTAVMNRVDTSPPQYLWLQGIAVGNFDQNRQIISGYEFLYGQRKDPITKKPVAKPFFIFRLDNWNNKTGTGVAKQLCMGESMTAPLTGKQTIQAMESGSLKLYLGGQLGCSASDSTYQGGNVLVEALVPYSGQYEESFKLYSVDIKPLP